MAGGHAGGGMAGGHAGGCSGRRTAHTPLTTHTTRTPPPCAQRTKVRKKKVYKQTKPTHTAGTPPGKPKQQATGGPFRVPETVFSSLGVLGDSEVCGIIWLRCAALLLLLCWGLLRGNAPAENHAPKSGAPLGLPEGERIS